MIKMMEMVKIVNMIFRLCSNMLFHVTYRSYSDGRTKDDLKNKTIIYLPLSVRNHPRAVLHQPPSPLNPNQG